MNDESAAGRWLRAPSADRHFIGRVRQNSLARALNTVIEPWVNLHGDLAAIRAHAGERVGDRLLVNGRTYGVEPSGTLYPISGPGFIQLERAAFKALGVYNEFGESPDADAILQRMHNQTSESRAAALAAYRAGRRRES